MAEPTWEKEFDRQFTQSHPGDSGVGGNDPQEPEYYFSCYPDDVKKFIRDLLQQKLEERPAKQGLREDLVADVIHKMGSVHVPIHMIDGKHYYNQCPEDIAKVICTKFSAPEGLTVEEIYQILERVKGHVKDMEGVTVGQFPTWTAAKAILETIHNERRGK